MPVRDFSGDFGSVIRRHFGHGSGDSSFADLSGEGITSGTDNDNDDHHQKVMTKLIQAATSQVASNDSDLSTATYSNLDTGEIDIERPTKPPLDLRTLWKLLEKMDAEKEREGKGSVVGISGLDDDDHSGHEGGKMSTWELVVLQAVLLSLLILVSLLWAFCCKRRCLTDRSALVHEVVAFARKISGGSSKSELPPSYSKTNLTDVGLTIDDHLNPPPTYDRAAALNMIELERKSGTCGPSSACPQRSSGSGGMRPYTSPASSHASLASTNIDHIVDIENHRGGSSSGGSGPIMSPTPSYYTGSNRSTTPGQTGGNSPGPHLDTTCETSVSSAPESRKSSGSSNRVTFTPGLISGPTPARKRPHSLPLVSVLVKAEGAESRKRSTQSEGGDPKDEGDIASIVIHSSNNLNSQRRPQPMI